MYKEEQHGYSNCEECMHKNVCSLKEEYSDYVLKINALAKEKFPIKITCSYFLKSQPLQRDGFSDSENLGRSNTYFVNPNV